MNNIDYLNAYKEFLPDIKLEGNRNQAKAKCPFHNDTRPSLSINLNNGRFYCFGCKKSGNLEKFKQLLNGQGNFIKREVATYDYTDVRGNILYQIVRYEPKDFRARRPDGNGGWIYNLDGVETVLYNLPQVINSDKVIIVEGEKDADNLNKLGFVATTNSFGAGKWKKEYNQYLKDKEIVIIPDNDEVGKKHSEEIANFLNGVAKSIKIVNLPNLSEGGKDISDWLEDKDFPTTIDELQNIIEATPNWEKKELIDSLLKWNDILTMDIKTEFILEGLIPKESITLLYGRGGIGKTWVAMKIAKAIAQGELFGELKTIKTPVFYIDFENPLEVLKERIGKIGKCDNLYIWHLSNKLSPPLLDSGDWELYKELPKGVLIFDTLRASHLKDENDSRPMAEVMQRLKQLRELGFTLLLLHHTPKADETIFKGSTAILDLADNILGLEEVKDEDSSEFSKDKILRLGHRIKTRYSEIKEVFLTFDEDKGIKITKDPDIEKIQDILEILKEFKEPPNQKVLKEKIKRELGYLEKEIRRLLEKGEEYKFWEVKKGEKYNQKLYFPKR